MFRNDRRHTGRSPYVGPTTATVAWTVVTGATISAQPVVGDDGTVYVGSHDHFFYAVDPTGRVKWKRDLGHRVYSTAYVDTHGNTYVGSDGETDGSGAAFWSFDAHGDQRWKLLTEGDADTGVTPSPDGSVLYFAAGSDLWAVTTDGNARWRFRAESKIYSTPCVDDDGTVYVGAQDDFVYAIASDGRLRWRAHGGDDYDSSIVLGDDGTVWASGDDRKVRALTRDGQQRWEYDAQGYVRGTVALGLDGSVLVPTYGPRPRLVALAPDHTGMRWFFPVTVADSAEVGIQSSPTVDHDGNVYVGAHDDYIYALTPEGELRWAYQTHGDVDSSPAIAPDGTLYVGSDDHGLYAFHDE
jgi:outer membrane protein assembly factor BamB